MRVSLSARLMEVQGAQRGAAIRGLLRKPVVTSRDDGELFAFIVRHARWLQGWFQDQPGWNLHVDSRAGHARLHKVPATTLPHRTARTRNRSPFDRRRYVLLCLALAALDDSPSQTTLVRLAEGVEELSGDDPDIDRFAPESFSERRCFVDVLRWLEDTGILTLRDGEVDRYARDVQVDALYDVNERLIGQLISAPVPPALAGDPERMRREGYAETPEGERLRARHTVFRRVLDEPVVYYEELSGREYEWLDHSRGFLYQRLRQDVGLQVERRSEGIAAVDPLGQVSDELFPDGGSTVKHAALLLAEDFTKRMRRKGNPAFTEQQVREMTGTLIRSFGERCGWSKLYGTDEAGAARLASDALDLLEMFGLLERSDGSVRLRPAIARFAPRASGQPGLFEGER